MNCKYFRLKMRNKNKTLGQMENDWYLKVKYFMSHQNDFFHRIEKKKYFLEQQQNIKVIKKKLRKFLVCQTVIICQN